MEPIDSSERVRKLFSTVFKLSDPKKKIDDLCKYMLKSYSAENRNNYRTQIGNRDHSFNSNYSVSGGRVFVDSSDISQVIKLIIIYFYKIEPELLKKTNYAPENLFARLKFDDYVEEWKPYLDKDVNDYLADHPKEGCLYSLDDIKANYPQSEATAQLTLYRVCNSLGKLITLDELKEGKIEAFKIESKTDNVEVGEGISSNRLFKECVEALKTFLLLNSSKAGKEKIRANSEIFRSYLRSLTPSKLDEKLANNPLVLAKFVTEFSDRTVSSKGFSDNFKAVKDLSPKLLEFIRKVFLVDASLNESLLFISLPKNSVVEILGDKFAVGEYMKIQNTIPPASNSSSLPPVVDVAVSKAFIKFFKQFGNFDDTLILDVMLFVFGKMTTNTKRWSESNELVVSIGDVIIKSRTDLFLSYVQQEVRKVASKFSTNNILRQWANIRGNRAKELFQLMKFRPNLFSQCPGIVPYMRFDFFKLIDLRTCTQEEIESYQTLRRMTESRSNQSECDERKLQAWILRK